MKTRLAVLSVGEVLVDFIAPRAESLEAAEEFVRSAGGAPANVAVAAARLGAPSALVSAVGDDPFGAYLRAVLEENGVDTTDVALRQGTDGRTTLAFVARNTGGIPDFVFYRGSDRTLSPVDIPTARLGATAFVHVSSMALTAEPCASATLHAIRAAHDAGVAVSVDPNLRPSSWPSLEIARATLEPLFSGADVLKVNDEEARLFTGQSDLGVALQQLAAADRRPLVVITLGPDGCVWRRDDDGGRVTAPQVIVEDTTGAGDAFVGAMLAELWRRTESGTALQDLSALDLEASLRFGTTAAALACTSTGAMTSLPTREAVDTLLAREA